MSSDRKENESLVEKLLQVYEQSNPKLDFSESQNQLEALSWVSRVMEQLKQNEREAKRNGR